MESACSYLWQSHDLDYNNTSKVMAIEVYLGTFYLNLTNIKVPKWLPGM